MEPFGCLAWAWIDGSRSHCSWEYVRNTLTAGSASLAFLTIQSLIQPGMFMRSTPSIGSGSLFLLTPQLFDSTQSDPKKSWHTHSVLASFLNLFSAANCAIVCTPAFLSMDGLLAMALKNNGEGPGDSRPNLSVRCSSPRE